PPWEQVLGVLLTLGFAVVYVALMRGTFGPSGRWRRGPLRWVVPLGLFAVSGVMAVIVGEASNTYVVFAVVVAVLVWPPVASLPVAVASMFWVGYLLPRLHGQGVAVELVVIVLAVTGMMFAVRRMQGQQTQIRRAHEDLA